MHSYCTFKDNLESIIRIHEARIERGKSKDAELVSYIKVCLDRYFSVPEFQEVIKSEDGIVGFDDFESNFETWKKNLKTRS
jgi:hypothetical protein